MKAGPQPVPTLHHAAEKLSTGQMGVTNLTQAVVHTIHSPYDDYSGPDPL